jgi:hypothetical protein
MHEPVAKGKAHIRAMKPEKIIGDKNGTGEILRIDTIAFSQRVPEGVQNPVPCINICIQKSHGGCLPHHKISLF